MKTTIKLLFTLFLIACFADIASAQDIILMRNKPDSIKAKIIEIGTNEIKYRKWPVDETMPIMVESKERIRRIILSNGTVMRFSENEFVDASNYVDQRKMIVKIDMFSIMYGTTSLSFEQSVAPGKSWEAGLGIIGLGFNKENFGYRTGAFVRAGYKFINTPDYYIRGMRYTHILKGAYIRPELCLQYYDLSSTEYYSNYSPSLTKYYQKDTKNRYTGIAAMINFGKQWVVGDMFAFDIFAGVGLGAGGTSKISETNTEITYQQYQNISYNYYNEQGPDFPFGIGFAVDHTNTVNVSGQIGFKLGYLIGVKKAK